LFLIAQTCYNLAGGIKHIVQFQIEIKSY